MQGEHWLSVGSLPERFDVWLKSHATSTMMQRAEELPLRRDLLTLLTFIRDHKVVGTQSVGNMPLKAIREVTASFVDPPTLDQTVGGHTYHLRSEEDLWSLYFLRILAEVGGLLQTGRGRAWRLKRSGQAFLHTPAMLQVAYLLATWWYRTNWVVAFPVTGLAAGLPRGFQATALSCLRALPVDQETPFEPFADGLVARSGLIWGSGESEFAPMSLRSSVARMVIQVLRDFGVLECRYEDRPIGTGKISTLVAFRVTSWGQALLNVLVTIR